MGLDAFICFLLLNILTPDISVIATIRSQIVTVGEGQVLGKILRSQEGRQYAAFLNIPYAEAGRFQAPSAPSKWKGVLEATEDGPECAYNTLFTQKRRGVEDCLSLNVYTPAIPAADQKEAARILNESSGMHMDENVHTEDETTEEPQDDAISNQEKRETSGDHMDTMNGSTPTKTGLFPVLVYLHGGVFSLSSKSSFMDAYMMDEDVVFVTLKYRVGPFGFLSTGDKVIPGNYGLKDQKKALEWIQTNIQLFGGDPNNVVLLGNGAGAVSANLHMISKKSSGLFHAAILHSGSALVPWGLTRKPNYSAHRLGKVLHCPSKNSGTLLACLLKKTTAQILDGIKKLLTNGPHPFAPFAPVLEPNFPGAFIHEHPYISMRNMTGVHNKVPVLVGVTENEDIFKRVAYISTHPSVLHGMNRSWKKIFPIIFEYNGYYTNFSLSTQKFVSKKIRKFYFNGKNIDDNNIDSLKRALADRLLNYAMKKTITLLAEHMPVYAYLLDSNHADSFENHRRVDAAMDGSANIVSNSLKVVSDFHQRSQAEMFLKHIISLITSFARNKKPTAKWGSETRWDPVSKSALSNSTHLQYYHIGPDTSLVPEPFTKGVEFWTTTLRQAGRIDRKGKGSKKHKRKH